MSVCRLKTSFMNLLWLLFPLVYYSEVIKVYNPHYADWSVQSAVSKCNLFCYTDVICALKYTIWVQIEANHQMSSTLRQNHPRNKSDQGSVSGRAVSLWQVATGDLLQNLMNSRLWMKSLGRCEWNFKLASQSLKVGREKHESCSLEHNQSFLLLHLRLCWWPPNRRLWSRRSMQRARKTHAQD